MIQHDRYGGGSVMVWGAISWGHKSELVIVDNTMDSNFYLDSILEPVAIPFGLGSIGQGFIFQDDNARPHRAQIVQDFHERHLDYTHLDWPPFSPDLNPIEHAWDMLGRAIKRLDQQPRTVEELGLELQVEWDNIPQAKIRKLIRSMRSRIRECIRARGGPSRY